MFNGFRPTQYNDGPKIHGTRQISDLLGRFSKLADDGEEARLLICMALLEAGIRIDKRYVSIRGATVYVKLPPAGKNELYLKQSRIVGELKKNPLTQKITAVR